jgi:phytoene dehydrogenase-like protein
VLPRTVDAVVIGSGPNGLVAAITLADAGWDVLLLEAAGHFGGAVHSTQAEGWVSDRCSSCYPLAVASPVMRALELERHGLRWARARLPLAHPLGPDDDAGAAIHPDVADTAAGLAEEEPADGDAWLGLYEDYSRIREPLLDALLTAWPPVRSGARLARTLGSAGEVLRFTRFMALPAHRMGAELFAGRRGRALIAGNAMHADAPLTAPVSGTMGWLLTMLAQDVGFPSAEGGSGKLVAALVRRAQAAGVELISSQQVTGIEMSAGRPVAVQTVDGRATVRRAVIADVSAKILYDELLSKASIPPRLRDDLDKFTWDLPTVKVNYRLSRAVPWTARHARSAGVVHLGGDADAFVHTCADLDTGRLPEAPFLLVGQTSTADPTRSPAGTEALWAYSHLPREITDDGSAELLAKRIDSVLEQHAPGFGPLVLDREVQRPGDFAAANASLGPAAVNGGTMQLFQQLVLRPVPGLGGPRTVVPGLYLGSAAIHPGGGVHGSCGWLAARAALRDSGPTSALRRRAMSALLQRLYR